MRLLQEKKKEREKNPTFWCKETTLDYCWISDKTVDRRVWALISQAGGRSVCLLPTSAYLSAYQRPECSRVVQAAEMDGSDASTVAD